MSDLGAAFGFFPQMKPRRQGLPSDSANLPIDVLRGRLAGLLGAPADIANLLRSPSPTEMFGDVSYDAPAQFPYTTDKFLKELPLAPTSRVGQAAGQVASFVPLNPMPAVRGVQKVGQVVGEELAATMLGQRPNTMMSKVVPQPLFAVPPEGLLSVKTEPIENLLQTKPQAPVSDIGFYSATEQAALNLGRNKGTGQSFINDLMKAPDVKKEELQFTGLEDFLTNKPNVTKQEVQDFLANNRVDVQEVTLGAPIAEDPIGIAKRKEIFDKYEPEIQRLSNELDNPNTYASGNHIKLLNEYNRVQDARNIEADAAYMIPEATPTNFGKYTLAGGDNYREILLTLPENMSAYDKYAKSLREKYGQGGFANLPLTDIERARLDKFYAADEVSPYKSSHFDQPNILAHMRVNDRIDADGKKMLLIEEIQSDWHQAGREKGYKQQFAVVGNKGERQFIGTRQQANEFLNKSNNPDLFLAPVGGSGVPDAPFKDTWYQLALKRLTKYAADNGYERIGLTTGRQQADRFNLAESFDAMNYKKNKDGTYALGVKPKGEGIFQNDFGGTNLSNIPEKELPSIVGKELAQKIISGEGRQAGNTNRYILEGIDLQVGGEGMKKYYDEIYPKFLDKYGKKYGAKVGETSINTGKVQSKDELAAQVYGRGEIYRNLPSEQKRKIDVMFMDMAKDEPIRYLDITPQMKEGTSKGQPLFAATPAIPAAGLLDEEKRKEITSLLDY